MGQLRNKDAGTGGPGGEWAAVPNTGYAGPPLTNALAETKRARRGHDFYPADMASWPKTYATDSIDTPVKEVLAHYFSAGTDHYIVESDADGYAFGYTILANYPDGAEWGYIDLVELEKAGTGLNIAERDLWHEKGTLVRDCIPKYMEGRNLVESQRPSQKVPALDASQLADRTDFRNDLSALDGEPDGALDLFVNSVVDGHLSRGTPGNAAADALTAWRIHAAVTADRTGDTRYTDFQRGLEIGAIALMRSKLDAGVEPEVNDGATWSEAWGQAATELARTKRSTTDDRELWKFKIRNAANDAHHRGILAAGAILSGTDSWWGFRDNVDRTILGD